MDLNGCSANDISSYRELTVYASFVLFVKLGINVITTKVQCFPSEHMGKLFIKPHIRKNFLLLHSLESLNMKFLN